MKKRITCYKLCYALGVSMKHLQADYAVEARVAQESGSFYPTAATLKFRAIASIYNFIMPEYETCLSVDKFREIMKSWNATYSAELSFDPIADRGDMPLFAYMNRIINEHNKLSRQVYSNLEIAMPLDCFLRVTHLPELTEKVIAELGFLLEKTTQLYNMYFYGRELLNVAFGQMIHNDKMLCDRMSLLCGEALPAFEDRSEFASALSAYLAAVQMKADNARKYTKYVLYLGANAKRKNVLNVILPSLLGSRMERLVECSSPSEFIEVVEHCNSVLCITTDAAWTSKTAPVYYEVDFLVALPIEQQYYKPWSRRRLPNIYFLDTWGQ